ncbi:ubiquitin-protein ligase (E3) [Mucor velutinosus]|uniref:Ubiquitin-protein ligase (E3) n=1 Tax=Mucor velutinosus TaxID=708070 RepID=A0AAN7DMV4_9FUNG|nr:ubiquitin-protein ligase (E3) [Mucor velutinosus]
MALKPSTIALISTAVVASFGLGFLIYYDSKRRSDPQFKKQLKRERKKAAKQEKLQKEKEITSVEGLIASVLETVANEDFPESAQEKEAYFMEKVALGEALCKEGREDDAVLPFYKALKIYPAPLELIMIYQKTVPEKVFRIIVNLMAVEQQKRQSEFYDLFPPAELNIKLQPTSTEGEKTKHTLVADRDFNQGEVVYVESPLISALHPQLEGSYCNFCMKKLTDDSKIECTNCDQVAFCSKECETKGSEQYHTFLCSNSKLTSDNKAVEFRSYAQINNVKYPQMIAQFLSSMVAEEMEKNKLGKDAPRYSAWDHIERFNQQELQANEETVKEATMIKELLASKVPGIDEFLSDEIYLLLKGKLNENTFEIPAASDVAVEKSMEPARSLATGSSGVGSSLYKISTFIGKSDNADDSNISIEFRDNSNVLTATASKNIKKGDEIRSFYV